MSVITYQPGDIIDFKLGFDNPFLYKGILLQFADSDMHPNMGISVFDLTAMCKEVILFDQILCLRGHINDIGLELLSGQRLDF